MDSDKDTVHSILDNIIASASRLKSLLKREEELKIANNCEHVWKFKYTGNHGSDKGHDYYECTKCVAQMEHGSWFHKGKVRDYKEVSIHYNVIKTDWLD